MAHYHKLNPWGFGLALGIVWGLSLAIVAWMSWQSEAQWGRVFIETLSSLYTGYAASLKGGMIGLLWGFVDMFIGGVVIAWLYNLFSLRKN